MLSMSTSLIGQFVHPVGGNGWPATSFTLRAHENLVYDPRNNIYIMITNSNQLL